VSLELSSIYIKELIDELYKRLSDKGVKHIIINGYTKISKSFRFSRNKIDLLKEVLSHKIVLGLSNGKGIYVSTLSDFTVDLDEYVETLINTLNRLKSEIEYSPPENGREIYEIIPGGYDDKILQSENVMNFLDKVLSGVPEEVKLSGSIHLNKVKHMIKTSYDVEGEYKRTYYILNLRVFKDKDITYPLNRVGSSFKKQSPEPILEEISKSLENMDYYNKIEEGRYNILFSPLAFANILHYVGSMFSGAEIYSNLSPFSGRLGESITEHDIDIYDDPREEGSPSAIPFDEEGVPRKKVYFVKNGALKSYALNNVYGKLLGLKTTGHAGIDSPYPKSLIFKLGDTTTTLDELLTSLKDAILINNLWYTRFSNYREGVFSTLQRDIGLYIKDGSFNGGFKGARINLSINELLQNIRIMSKENIWTKPWDVDIPSKLGYVLVENVKITTGV